VLPLIAPGVVDAPPAEADPDPDTVAEPVAAESVAETVEPMAVGVAEFVTPKPDVEVA